MTPNENPIPKDDMVCAIVVGRAQTCEKAQSMVRASKACPYVALYTAKDCTVVGIFTLPRTQEAWLEYPSERPKYLDGLAEVVTVITDQVQATSPWSAGLIQPLAEETPCKQRCDRCSRYGQDCAGCPATIFFMAAE